MTTACGWADGMTCSATRTAIYLVRRTVAIRLHRSYRDRLRSDAQTLAGLCQRTVPVPGGRAAQGCGHEAARRVGRPVDRGGRRRHDLGRLEQRAGAHRRRPRGTAADRARAARQLGAACLRRLGKTHLVHHRHSGAQSGGGKLHPHVGQSQRPAGAPVVQAAG